MNISQQTKVTVILDDPSEFFDIKSFDGEQEVEARRLVISGDSTWVKGKMIRKNGNVGNADREILANTKDLPPALLVSVLGLLAFSSEDAKDA